MAKERVAKNKNKAGTFADMLRKGKQSYQEGADYEGMTFDRVPAGTYMVRLLSVEWRLSKNNNLMLHREHSIIEGEHKGRTLFDNMVYGVSDYGTGLIRQYLSLVTGEPCPEDPADLESLVAGLLENNPYDAKVRVRYQDDSDFAKIDVMEIYEADDDDATESDEVETVEETNDDDDDDTDEVEQGDDDDDDDDDDGDNLSALLEFCTAQDIELDKKAKKDIDQVKAEIGKWEFDEDDLSPEEIELLESEELDSCILRKPPVTQAKKKTKKK